MGGTVYQIPKEGFDAGRFFGEDRAWLNGKDFNRVDKFVLGGVGSINYWDGGGGG